ncbi:unnamed protein product [Nyctereutes procyonoides]|uniref:(raccoon dog) hypothetical protein n=1 Tax=Nyctereutes procyonoides TaxID=34880 RepID=A0A811YSH5_NYCPR|nr:unnamed protein product [Nyctereutes procyonoides]
MSFTTRSTFSSNYRSLGSVQSPSHRVWPISSSVANLLSCSTSFRGGWGSSSSASRMVGGLAGIEGIQGEETMRDLNDCLASYLERVRNLEVDNQKLVMKMREHLEKKGPQVRDWGHYFKTMEDLRAQIFASAMDNARIVLQIDNYETELAMCQSMEQTEIKALKEELLFMKKNHEEEIKGVQNQIANSGLMVALDAPKSQDLSKIVADIQAQYDELAQKNWEELDKYWSHRTAQSLEINLDSMRNLKASLENSLREVETLYAMQMEQLNGVLLYLESELPRMNVNPVECQGQTEAEIATYRRLLEDWEDFSLIDALDNSDSLQTIHKTTTHKIVDGKVMSKTKDTKILRR